MNVEDNITQGQTAGQFSLGSFRWTWNHMFCSAASQARVSAVLEMRDSRSLFGPKFENLRFVILCFILKPYGCFHQIRLEKLLRWPRSFLKSVLKDIFFSRNCVIFLDFSGHFFGPTFQNLRIVIVCFILKLYTYYHQIRLQ